MIEPAVARRIKLVGFDVDGVLTDGGLFLGGTAGQPAEFKRFHTLDGMAFWLLRQAGVRVALVSGRHSEATAQRARELRIEDVVQDATGGGNKLAPFEALLAQRGLRLDECAFVGDDLPDLPVLRRVALPVAVANAVDEVKSAARHTTERPGGQGAVREFVETLLKARGVWHDVVRGYLRERGDVTAR